MPKYLWERFLNSVQKSSKDLLRRVRFGREAVTHPPSKKEGLRNIGHSMSLVLDTKKFNFGNQQYLRFHIWFTVTLYYKMRRTLLQNTSIITKYLDFIAKCYSYYRIRCLLKSALVHPVMIITFGKQLCW